MSTPLPEPWDYCYEWHGPFGTRKFSAASHNGNRPDRSVPLYTADQLHAHAAAVTAERDAEIAALRAEVAGLREFVGKVLGTHREHGCCDIDGSDVQDWALAAGLLHEVEVTESCGAEDCACMEYYGEITEQSPAKCLRLTDAGQAALAARKGGGMRSGIEQARLELTKWEARVADDKAALATAEAQASYIRDRLAGAEQCAKGLRDAVSLWDAMHTKGEA